jgi:hypothetical protein
MTSREPTHILSNPNHLNLANQVSNSSFNAPENGGFEVAVTYEKSIGKIKFHFDWCLCKTSFRYGLKA